jgi:hypothetical protein
MAADLIEDAAEGASLAWMEIIGLSAVISRSGQSADAKPMPAAQSIRLINRK